MNESVVRLALRAVALAIAAAAIVDPAITSLRPVKPLILVSALDSARDSRLAEDVSRAIDDQFSVSRTFIAGASAAILIGDRLPDSADELPRPTFTVVPVGGRVAIEQIDVPPTAPLDARAPVVVRIAARGAAGRTLEVTLRAGTSVAERTARRLSRDDTTIAVALSFVPTAAGATRVRVSATLSGSDQPMNADAVVDVRDRRWDVLFFDSRPSWMSTFVRRSIERDSRFMVTSRVMTSRDVSANTGRPPARLSDPASLSAFDAIVVGAPQGLSAPDVAGLDAFMRRRGGSVVFLLDEHAPGPHDRLMAVPAWSSIRSAAQTLASQGDSAALRASDVVWPTLLPAGATSVAGAERAAVWESPIGAGRLVVSGALDSWRFRESSMSGFDRFWRRLIADVASASPPAVSVVASPAIAFPGEAIDVKAVVRDAALQPVSASASVRASITGTVDPGGALRLFPGAEVGTFGGALHAPREPGVYRVTVASDGGSATVPVIVAADARRAAPASRPLLDAWTTAHGGRLFSASEMNELSAAVRDAVRPPSRLVNWHPFRSIGWLGLFVLALSGEWWLRRRRGLR